MSQPVDGAEAPRVSVVVTAFNAELCIETTLASALNQTYTDLEILVIDDGSTDSTAAAIRRIAEADPRCRLITQSNHGPSAARNRGIKEARGELIAFLDHDDLWHPDKIALQLALLDGWPDAGVVTCYSTVIGGDGRCLGWRLGGQFRGSVYAEMIEWDMVSGGSVVMVRRAALEANGLFDENLRFREDWDMWIRLARRVQFVTVPQSLVGFTRHAGNSSRDYEQMAREGELVLRKTQTSDPAFNTARFRYCLARDLFGVACLCGIDFNRKLAWHYIARSWAVTPSPLVTSPRRWAFVAVLILQSLLPPPAFRLVFNWLSRVSFRLEPGQPFLLTGSGN